MLSLACLCNIWGPWAVLGWPISGEWKGSLFPSSCPAVSAETLPGAPFLRTSANLPNASLSLNGKKQLLKAQGTGKKGRSGSSRPSREGGKRSCRRRLSPLILLVLSSLPPSLCGSSTTRWLAQGPQTSQIGNTRILQQFPSTFQTQTCLCRCSEQQQPKYGAQGRQGGPSWWPLTGPPSQAGKEGEPADPLAALGSGVPLPAKPGLMLSSCATPLPLPKP